MHFLTIFTALVGFAVGTRVAATPVSSNTLDPRSSFAYFPNAPQTNAARMARGLGPAAPVKRHPVYSTRRSTPARRATTSPLPKVKKGGFLEFTRASNNQLLGYLTPKLNEVGEYGTLTKIRAEALQVDITYNPVSPRKNDLVPRTISFQEFPFMGAALWPGTKDLTKGQFSYGWIVPGTQTAPGATGATSPNAFSKTSEDTAYYQSAIWNVEPLTGVLSATWVNSDGKPVDKTVFAYFERSQLFTITADVASLAAGWGSEVSEVKVRIVDDIPSVAVVV